MLLSYFEIEQKASKRARVHGSGRVYRKCFCTEGVCPMQTGHLTEEHGVIFQICPQVKKTRGKVKKKKCNLGKKDKPN